jgi:hypothetical protein
MERGYPVRLLCGGARTPIDLTGVVGGALSVTINWHTFAEVLASGESPKPMIDVPLDPSAIATLSRSFNDVELALRPDGLHLEAFGDFGPVRYFRGLFHDGWADLLAAVGEYRAARTGAQQGSQQ